MYFPAEQDYVRTKKGASQFKMCLDPNNLGVMLRRKFDYLYPPSTPAQPCARRCPESGVSCDGRRTWAGSLAVLGTVS